MSAITIKNIPESLYDQLKMAAKQHHRSINSELIVCLEKIFTPQTISTEEHIDGARRIRNRLTQFKVTEEDMQEMKADGRK